MTADDLRIPSAANAVTASALWGSITRSGLVWAVFRVGIIAE
jgi:hypothetical protein